MNYSGGAIPKLEKLTERTDAIRFSALWAIKKIDPDNTFPLQFIPEAAFQKDSTDIYKVATAAAFLSQMKTQTLPEANLFLPVMEKMSKKKIKQRVIFDERALKQIANCKKFPLVQTKTMAVEHMSPAETNIFRDNIAIILWGKTPQGFLIKNKEIADSFRKYFEVMWGIAT